MFCLKHMILMYILNIFLFIYFGTCFDLNNNNNNKSQKCCTDILVTRVWQSLEDEECYEWTRACVGQWPQTGVSSGVVLIMVISWRCATQCHTRGQHQWCYATLTPRLTVSTEHIHTANHTQFLVGVCVCLSLYCDLIIRMKNKQIWAHDSKMPHMSALFMYISLSSIRLLEDQDTRSVSAANIPPPGWCDPSC